MFIRFSLILHFYFFIDQLQSQKLHICLRLCQLFARELHQADEITDIVDPL